MSAAEEPEERSRAAGGCVLAVLGGGALAAVFAVDEAAGALTTVTLGAVALWRSARRIGTDQPLPSPTDAPPLGDDMPGHGPVHVARREGLSIFLRDDADNPARTHVRVQVDDEPDA